MTELKGESSRVLVDVAELYGRWRMEHGPQMTEQAAQKIVIENAEEGETLVAAFYRGELATLAASDFTRGVAAALACEPLAFTQFAAARACLEACALSRWLLDPSIENSIRIERICEVVRRDVSEGFKLAKQSNLIEANVYFQGRLDDLQATVEKLGVRTNRDKVERVTSYGVALNLSELALSQLSAVHEYRLWSGVVHGASWALMRAGLAENDSTGALFATPIVEIRRDAEADDSLVMATLRCFSAAAIETVSVMGWDRDAFVQRIAEICGPYDIDVTNPKNDQTANDN